MEQIRKAMERQVPVGVVLADAGYGKGTQFRTDLTQLGLPYVVGMESNATVWEPGEQPAGTRAPTSRGAPAKRVRRHADHKPISVKQLALGLPSSAWRGWVGVRAVKELYAPASPPSGFALRIATTGARNPIRSGF